MKRLLLALALFSLPLTNHHAFAAARQKTSLFPVTVTDDQGRHVRLTSAPKRIISLFADDTEILFALNLGRRVVGDGSQYAEYATGIVNAKGNPRDFHYPAEWPSKWGRDYPVKAPKLPHVEGGEGQTQFNLETIESLRPNLILSPYYATQEPTYQKLHDLGFKVLFLNPSTISGVFRDITFVGKATGARSEATTVVRKMKAELATVKRSLRHVTKRPAVYYEIDGTNPTQPYTAGPGTIPDQAIKLVHARNIADSITSCSGPACYPSFSLEEIVASNPKAIILADAAYGVTADSVKSRAGFDQTSAVKNDRIYAINPDLLSRFGPRVVIGVRTLAKLIHPGAFKG